MNGSWKRPRPHAAKPMRRLYFSSSLLCAYCMRSEERRVGKECRSLCDWSSDVCSSDLEEVVDERQLEEAEAPCREADEEVVLQQLLVVRVLHEIGRASCRERV